MFTTIRRWSQLRRYRSLARQLRSLPTRELHALGIAPALIDHLAFEASHA
jgi:hypothetical protein